MSITFSPAPANAGPVAVRPEVARSKASLEAFDPRPARVEIHGRPYAVDVLRPEDMAITGAVILMALDTGEAHTVSVSLETGCDCTCGSMQFVRQPEQRICKHLAYLLACTEHLNAEVALDFDDRVTGVRRSPSKGVISNDPLPRSAAKDAARDKAFGTKTTAPTPSPDAGAAPGTVRAVAGADAPSLPSESGTAPCCPDHADPADACLACAETPREHIDALPTGMVHCFPARQVCPRPGILRRSGLLDPCSVTGTEHEGIDPEPTEADIRAMLADRPDPAAEAWNDGYRAALLAYGVGPGAEEGCR